MPASRASRDGYIRFSAPVRAQVSRLVSASALRARWATTYARDQSGSGEGAASWSSVNRSTAAATMRSPSASQDSVVAKGGVTVAESSDPVDGAARARYG
jgi:hypothetical protein